MKIDQHCEKLQKEIEVKELKNTVSKTDKYTRGVQQHTR